MHCYYDLGFEPTELHLMPRNLCQIITLSEALRKLSRKTPWPSKFADSIYVFSNKTKEASRI